MLKEPIKNKPLIYSCSGCSSAAQMTNYIALQFDRKEIAEMRELENQIAANDNPYSNTEALRFLSTKQICRAYRTGCLQY